MFCNTAQTGVGIVGGGAGTEHWELSMEIFYIEDDDIYSNIGYLSICDLMLPLNDFSKFNVDTNNTGMYINNYKPDNPVLGVILYTVNVNFRNVYIYIADVSSEENVYTLIKTKFVKKGISVIMFDTPIEL